MKYIQLLEKKVIERSEGVPYLVRWNLFGIGKDSRYFSIKLHKILRSDDECLHDHPWRFMSIILWGGYTEYAQHAVVGMESSRWSNAIWSDHNKCWIVHRRFRPGSILFRRARWAHRLVLDRPCWTLVLTFKKVRSWGFYTRQGWISWRQYSHANHCN